MVSTNTTDLVLDFSRNNTAFFIDAAEPAAILASNLDAPITYDNSTEDDDMFTPYRTVRVVTTTYVINLTSPAYLAVDERTELLLFTDTSSGRRTVNYARSGLRNFCCMGCPYIYCVCIYVMREYTLYVCK